MSVPFWIIPARAGFTAYAMSWTPPCADHPRSRGVYTVIVRYLSVTVGSSPLARGLHARIDSHVADLGIIPARAGFTLVRLLTCALDGDHPRSRGVYVGPFPGLCPVAGSSPLARGLLGYGGLPRRGGGIIPARAGFTPRPRPTRSAPRDHPRSRGVYILVDCGDSTEGGSSPLARGLLVTRDRYRPGCGIIPARAGFTFSLDVCVSIVQDHPRSRGVYHAVAGCGGWVAGSSPLARGLRTLRVGGAVVRRIIPARAGFTRALSPSLGTGWDHPRSRGVYRGNKVSHLV